MKENQTLKQVTEEYQKILKSFYAFVIRENELQLNEEDIKNLISGTPFILHFGKNATGRFPLLLNSKKENKLKNSIIVTIKGDID